MVPSRVSPDLLSDTVVALLSLIIPFDSALAKYVVSVGQTQLPGNIVRGPRHEGTGWGG